MNDAINCDICGADVPVDEIYTDRHDNTICKKCHSRTEPRNSERRKCLAKTIGLLCLAWNALPVEVESDWVGATILQAVDDLQAQLENPS